jgi:hypothetical protein
LLCARKCRSVPPTIVVDIDRNSAVLIPRRINSA